MQKQILGQEEMKRIEMIEGMIEQDQIILDAHNGYIYLINPKYFVFEEDSNVLL